MLRLDWPLSPATEYVTAYKVYESANGGSFSLKGSVTDNFIQFTNPPGHYAWKVSAVNFVGESDPSPVTEGPDVPSAPAAPTLSVL